MNFFPQNTEHLKYLLSIGYILFSVKKLKNSINVAQVTC